MRKNSDQALKEYEEGVDLAQKQRVTKCSRSRSRRISSPARSTAGSWDDAKKWAYEIIADAPTAPDSHDKAEALLSAGKGCVDAFTQNESDNDGLRLKAYSAYQQAAKTSKKIGDNRALSYALGYQGELYQMEGKSDDALVLSAATPRRSRSSSNRPIILFRWQWQIARILGLQKKREEAITAYQSAVTTLQTIRHDMSLHFGNTYYHSSFREAAGSVYFELADLLASTRR